MFGTGYGNLASLFVCYEVGGTAKLCTRPTSTELNVTAAENCGHSLKEPNNSGLEITRHLLQGSAAPRGTGMWASGGSSMAHSPILIAVVPGGGARASWAHGPLQNTKNVMIITTVRRGIFDRGTTCEVWWPRAHLELPARLSACPECSASREIRRPKLRVHRHRHGPSPRSREGVSSDRGVGRFAQSVP